MVHLGRTLHPPPPPDTPSSIQEPFGCSANPALVVRLERTAHTTHTTRITKIVHFVVPWAAGKKTPPKNTASSLHNHKIQTAALQIKRRYELLHTHQHTPTHTDTASSIQAPFGCPANPALVGHFGTHTAHTTHNTHNTHNENSSLRCALGCRKKHLPKNTASSLQNHKIQTAALQIKRRYQLHTLHTQQQC